MAVLQEHNGIRSGDPVSWRLNDSYPRCYGTVNYVESSWTRCGGTEYHFNVRNDHGVSRRISARFITKESE